MKIHKLSKKIIANVAAGEVVENIASIIKELVENSIDAGATDIQVYLENSGINKIRLIDNGEGMEKEDLEICYKRYTTSKINKLEDLYNIKTLGYRGEALYSISNVSQTTIQSKTKNNLWGNLLSINFGKKTTIQKIGMQEGTIVEIKNLYNNLPARKKFILSKNKELNTIIETVKNLSLINSKTSFKIYNNNKLILSLTETKNLLKRIQEILNIQKNNIIKIKEVHEYFSYSIYLAKPQFSSKYLHQYIYINNRAIKHKQINDIFKKTYSNIIPYKYNPKFVIKIKINANRIDTNVHPRKETILIHDYEKLELAIKNSLQKSIESKNMTYNIDYSFSKKSYDQMDIYIKENITPWNFKDEKIKEVIQIGNLYLATQYKNSLILIDQHAAHEKILYNQFIDFYINNKEIKELKNPVNVELNNNQQKIINTYKKLIKKLGFIIERFGNNDVKITHAPVLFEKKDLVKIFIEILEDIENQNIPEIDEISKKIISHMACRTAIKSNDYLEHAERIKLVDQVIQTREQNYTCPHGRPVLVEIKINDLHKIFNRN